MCVISTGSVTDEDAFIEWFYHIPITSVCSESFISGKFTFSASATYIRNIHGTYGFGGPLGHGIPMFVQPSHNQF